MSATVSSSRSSMSSVLDLQYSREQLLQLAGSRGSQSSTAASANLLQHNAQFSLADILVDRDDGSSSSSRASSRLSTYSSSEEDLGDQAEGEEEDGTAGWVYGEGPIRTDLPAGIVEQVRRAVRLALENPTQPPASTSSSFPSISSTLPKPAAVPASTNTAGLRHPPRTYDDDARGGRAQQRSANPGDFFGRSKKTAPPRSMGPASTAGGSQVPPTTTAVDNHGNLERNAWRSDIQAARKGSARLPKEADSTFWRQMEPGAHWSLHKNNLYVTANA